MAPKDGRANEWADEGSGGGGGGSLVLASWQQRPPPDNGGALTKRRGRRTGWTIGSVTEEEEEEKTGFSKALMVPRKISKQLQRAASALSPVPSAVEGKTLETEKSPRNGGKTDRAGGSRLL